MCTPHSSRCRKIVLWYYFAGQSFCTLSLCSGPSLRVFGRMPYLCKFNFPGETSKDIVDERDACYYPMQNFPVSLFVALLAAMVFSPLCLAWRIWETHEYEKQS